MKRGAIVLVRSRKKKGAEPRPALVVQSDLFNPTHASITVCPLTGDVVDAPLFRVTLPPGMRTGLASVAQVMVDKTVGVPRGRIVREIGECDAKETEAVGEALRRWLAVE